MTHEYIPANCPSGLSSLTRLGNLTLARTGPCNPALVASSSYKHGRYADDIDYLEMDAEEKEESESDKSDEADEFHKLELSQLAKFKTKQSSKRWNRKLAMA